MLLPSAIQLAHVIENHEHTVCISVTEKHVHEKEVDCDIFHKQLQPFAFKLPARLEVIPSHFYATTFTEIPPVFHAVYHSKKHSRGPPHFIV